MPKFDIPPKPNLAKQLLMIAIVLIVLAVVVAVIAKLAVAFVILLLGMVFGIGSQVIKDNPLE